MDCSGQRTPQPLQEQLPLQAAPEQQLQEVQEGPMMRVCCWLFGELG